MFKLYEYQAKEIFFRHGIAVPRGGLATSAEGCVEVFRRLGLPVVLKPQLEVKGRGKVGGILFASSEGEVERVAEELFGREIHGEEVKRIWVEERVEFVQELYVAVLVNYSEAKVVLLAGEEGGVEVERLVLEGGSLLHREEMYLSQRPSEAYRRRVEGSLGEGVWVVLERMLQIFRQLDGELVEINPLVRTVDGGVMALDGVLNVNEDSLFRQEELERLRQERVDRDSLEERARRHGWTYLELGGEIGILSSGAGITMAILDMFQRRGLRPANFLDTAQMDGEGIYKAFQFLLENPRVRGLFVNILAGLNRCDWLAEGMVRFVEEFGLELPLVVRMMGNRELEGRELLRARGVEVYGELEESIEALSRKLELGEGG
ncbi:MAG: succinate--CoA ligase subunit beta [Planctomycetota bacterium]|nr:MAG: succinate--CoA ligase subunit beta [Planctomycetota bacterium]